MSKFKTGDSIEWTRTDQIEPKKDTKTSNFLLFLGITGFLSCLAWIGCNKTIETQLHDGTIIIEDGRYERGYHEEEIKEVIPTTEINAHLAPESDLIKLRNLDEKMDVRELEFEETLSVWDSTRLAYFALSKDLVYDYDIPMQPIQFYDKLMKVMYAECKFKTGHAAINKKSNAKGAIQWTKRMRKRLDVPENINELSLINQLTYVEEYFRHRFDGMVDGSKVKTFADVYMIIFAPAYANSPDSKVMYAMKSKCPKCYTQNRAYDRNGDGKITKGEAAIEVIRRYY